MFPNRLAFALLAVACLAAAAGGGYLATRQNAVPAVTQAAGTTPQSPPVAGPGPLVGSVAPEPAASVQDSQDGAKKPVAAEAAVSKAASELPKRVDAPSRAASAQNTRSSRPGAIALRAPTPLPSIDETWPVSPVSAPAQTPNVGGSGSAAQADQTPASREDRTAEAPRAAEPQKSSFEELVVGADQVVGLQAETTVTSERAHVEDRVEAKVTRDVRVRDAVAIPAGARALGTVVSVERGGKFSQRARIGVRFNTLVLADGTELPISTDTIYREGDSQAKESASKMTGAAVGGAILGAILGGGKGAAIGGAVGAGAGAAGVMASDRSQATLHAGEPITVRLLSPVTVTIEQK